jgi:hypothetical protein
MPEEIADLRDALDQAMLAAEIADDASTAAEAELEDARSRRQQAYDRLAAARAAEQEIRGRYVAALRAHHYVDTADGPRRRGHQAIGECWCGGRHTVDETFALNHPPAETPGRAAGLWPSPPVHQGSDL